MSCTRDAQMGWTQISIALGLRSTAGMTTTAIAEEFGVSKQAVSRGTAKFLRMAQLDPAWGLKSTEARRTYRRCH